MPTPYHVTVRELWVEDDKETVYWTGDIWLDPVAGLGTIALRDAEAGWFDTTTLNLADGQVTQTIVTGATDGENILDAPGCFGLVQHMLDFQLCASAAGLLVFPSGVVTATTFSSVPLELAAGEFRGRPALVARNAEPWEGEADAMLFYVDPETYLLLGIQIDWSDSSTHAVTVFESTADAGT